MEAELAGRADLVSAQLSHIAWLQRPGHRRTYKGGNHSVAGGGVHIPLIGRSGWTGATGCALATGSPDSVSCMFCGVIFGWANSPGLPTMTSC
jgi:hypothetical protein